MGTAGKAHGNNMSPQNEKEAVHEKVFGALEIQLGKQMKDGQAKSQFEYQDAGRTKNFIQQIKQNFRQPFMIEPFVVWEWVIIGIGFGYRSRLPDIFAKLEMAPQIKIGTGKGKGVDRVAVNQNPRE